MLQIKNIRKEYKTGALVQKALDGVSLNFRDSEFVAILGPSGSGKTTLLNIIGGLDRYDSGDLVIKGISTKNYKDKDWDSYRNHTIGFVFQSYNLIPHQTVLANVELALTISGISKSERKRRATEALVKVGLGEQLHKIPSQMSGGQMQRVAIARALVNNPDILLADEPTGALDTNTSVQVMELLKEVAKDRLVIMVTHNPELAEEYATRIVNLKDGQIIADSDPFIINEEEAEPPKHKNMGKSSMSFLTALSLSFNNLLTKKARTILVAIAGSIGIIGIALILSISNGANKYISDIEEDTLSEYPVEITSTGISLASLMGAMNEESDEESEVTEMKTVTSILSKMNSNDLASLKTFIDNDESDMKKYSRHISYHYNITPLVYKDSPDELKQVNPYSVLSSFDNGMSDFYSGFAMTGTSMSMTELFHEMPDSEELYKNSYDVMAGRWPENYDECILVLTENSKVSDLALFAMGLKDDSKLEETMKNYNAKGSLSMEETEEDEKPGTYHYKDFLDITFRLVYACDLYKYDKTYKVWTSKADNKKFMKEQVKNGELLTIVGVVRVAEDARSAMLSPGLNYPYELTEHIIDHAAQSRIVKEQLKNKDIDVFKGVKFGEDKNEPTLEMNELFSIDEDAMKDAFKVDTDALNPDISEFENGELDMGDLSFDDISMDGMSFDDINMEDIAANITLPEDFSMENLAGNMDLSEMIDINELISSLPEIKAEDILGLLRSVKIDISPADIRKTVESITDGFLKYAALNPQADISRLRNSFSDFLSTDEARRIILEGIRSAENATPQISNEDLNNIAQQVSAGYADWAEANGITDPASEFSTRFPEYMRSEAVLQIIRESMTGILQRQTENMEQADFEKISSELNAAYEEYARRNQLPDAESITRAFSEYMSSTEVENIISENILSKIDTSELEEELNRSVSKLADSYSSTITDMISNAFSSYSDQIGESMSGMVTEYASAIGEAISGMISSKLQDTMESFSDNIRSALADYITTNMDSYFSDMDGLMSAFSFNEDAFKNAITMNMNEDELTELLTSLMSDDNSNYESNLKTLGYADRAVPYRIVIYPKDFEGKEHITGILEDYNKRMEESDQKDKVIMYTDMVGTLMSSVTTILDAISYVLIAFVSISLIVSSIMIGVITYISVLERRKEIGILRSIGASKRNISNVFNAETMITGLLAGLFGIGITYLLLIPANAVLHMLVEGENLAAFLPVSSAGILVLLSIFLTFIGGLIPSRKAANSDPVTALRND